MNRLALTAAASLVSTGAVVVPTGTASDEPAWHHRGRRSKVEPLDRPEAPDTAADGQPVDGADIPASRRRRKGVVATPGTASRDAAPQT